MCWSPRGILCQISSVHGSSQEVSLTQGWGQKRQGFWVKMEPLHLTSLPPDSPLSPRRVCGAL